METAVSQRNVREGMFAHDGGPFGGMPEIGAQDAVIAVFGLAVALCAFGIACGRSVDLQLGPLSMHVG